MSKFVQKKFGSICISFQKTAYTDKNKIIALLTFLERVIYENILFYPK